MRYLHKYLPMRRQCVAQTLPACDTTTGFFLSFFLLLINDRVLNRPVQNKTLWWQLFSSAIRIQWYEWSRIFKCWISQTANMVCVMADGDCLQEEKSLSESHKEETTVSVYITHQWPSFVRGSQTEIFRNKAHILPKTEWPCQIHWKKGNEKAWLPEEEAWKCHSGH